MNELINLSSYAVDLERFDCSWDEVRRFCTQEGLAGIELLCGGEYDNNVPPGLVSSVHLPGWLGWVRLWREPKTVPVPADPVEERYYYGGSTRDDLLASFRAAIGQAASLRAAYAVFHITHIELAEFFTRDHRYTTREVITAAASFLNEACSVYPGGEPPVSIGLENLWWPGLTFGSPEETDLLSGLLLFDNWCYVLDTGHLMNLKEVRTEQEGIEEVVRAIRALPGETVDRIRSMHLQCSVSGPYQREQFFRDPPEVFDTLTYSKKMAYLMPLVGGMDEHRAFSDPGCREIVETVMPEYLVHEFVTRSREELEANLHRQRQALGLTNPD